MMRVCVCPLRLSFSKLSCNATMSSRPYNKRTELSIEAAFALKGRSLTVVNMIRSKGGNVVPITGHWFGGSTLVLTNQSRTLHLGDRRLWLAKWTRQRAKSVPQVDVLVRDILSWTTKKKLLALKNMDYDYSNILYLSARLNGLTNM